MKHIITVFTLLASSVLADKHLSATPAAAPEADSDIGQTECKNTNPMSGDEETLICQFFQECHTSKNDTLSGCIPKGNKVCDLYSEYGTTGDVIKNNIQTGTCAPYQTCCDLECCNPDQVCIDVWSQMTISYAYSTPQSLEHIARNGWKTMKGKKVENLPRKCVDSKYKMDPMTGFKSVYMPICGLAVTGVIFVLAIMKNQEGILEIIWPLLVIVTSFFLVLSKGWVMALMCTFLAAATMAAGDQDKKWLVFFQMFFMWVYFGGESYGVFSKAPTNFFTSAIEKNTKQLATECSTYFNYYEYETHEITWDMDPNQANHGICGNEFISYLIFIVYGQAFALFLMTTFTVVNYLNPGTTTETKNPATNVEMGGQ